MTSEDARFLKESILAFESIPPSARPHTIAFTAAYSEMSKVRSILSHLSSNSMVRTSTILTLQVSGLLNIELLPKPTSLSALKLVIKGSLKVGTHLYCHRSRPSSSHFRKLPYTNLRIHRPCQTCRWSRFQAPNWCHLPHQQLFLTLRKGLTFPPSKLAALLTHHPAFDKCFDDKQSVTKHPPHPRVSEPLHCVNAVSCVRPYAFTYLLHLDSSESSPLMPRVLLAEDNPVNQVRPKME